MSDQLEKLLAQKPMKKPAKAWVNWARALEQINNPRTGGKFGPGEIYCGPDTWPSKDIAEQKASESFARNYKKYGRLTAEYLGAFPEGERP